MYIIDSTYSNSGYKAISIDSQIMYSIYNTSNKISHFHGKWWIYLDNSTVCYAKREWGGERERNS